MSIRIKTLLLVAFLLAFCAGAACAEEITRDGVTYLVEQNVAYIVGFVQDAELVRIPATLDGKYIKLSLREDWGQHKAKKLVIEASPIDMKDNSLQYWNVEEMVFEEGITSIAERAFSSCTIGTLSLPSTLREISPYAFAFCTGPENLVIPEGVESIGDSAFCYSGIKTVSLPATVKSLGASVFSGNHEMTGITVSEDNPSYCMRSGALYTKDGKTLVCFPFAEEKEWTIPDGTTAIQQDALYSPYLQTLRIGEGLEVLRNEMISGCYRLRELYLPASLQKIEDSAIGGLALEKIALSQESAFFETDGYALYQKENRELVRFFNNDAKSYSILPGTTRIYRNAFAEKGNLETVIIPRGVRVIEPGTFNECESLAVVQLPITLEAIEESAFSSCFLLERIVLPVNLKRIEDWAFSNCQSLTALEIPQSVESVGDYAFSGCRDLTLTAKSGTQGALYARRHNTQQKAVKLNTQYGIVANDSKDKLLNLHSEPNANSSVIGAYQNGTAVRVLPETQEGYDIPLGEDDGWIHVAIGEKEGYLPNKYVRDIYASSGFFDPYSGTMKKTLAVLRYPLEGSGSDFSVSSGSSVDIIDIAGCYYLIEENGRSGFVLTTDISVDVPDNLNMRIGFVANPDYRDRLNLRASPSTDAESLNRFFNGAQVEILSEQGEWYHVRVSAWYQEGYMMKKFIQTQ